MREYMIRSSLGDIQRRRIRGLGTMASLTDSSLPAGASVADIGAMGMAVRGAVSTRLPATSVVATPLLRYAGPLSIPFTGAVAADDKPMAGGGTVPGVTFYEAGGSRSPVAAAASPAEEAAAADEDRAASGGFITDDSARETPDVVVPGATATPVGRYKWWILGLLVVVTGAGAWTAWRVRRRR